MIQTLFDKVPTGLNSNVTGWLVYDSAKTLPNPTILDTFSPFDDFKLVPKDGQPLMDKVDFSFNLDVTMKNLADGVNYAFFNDHTYTRPKVPTLYTALTSGALATNTSIYGTNTNAFVLRKNDVVEIILNNNDKGRHPFHLHGHAFQAIARSEQNAGNWAGNETFPNVPMKRDTFMAPPNGNIVLRFRADNPGVWLFHCHIEWHIASGLVATMIEAPTDLRSTLSIPSDHLEACTSQNIPTAGNAAGNTRDLLDLTGEDLPPGPLPVGFTARGIVAFVFSVISALVGMAVIAWYGSLEIGKTEPKPETVEEFEMMAPPTPSVPVPAVVAHQ
jgi:iron transport multicopper oxidase